MDLLKPVNHPRQGSQVTGTGSLVVLRWHWQGHRKKDKKEKDDVDNRMVTLKKKEKG